jgi:hypothetical protein
MQVATAKNDRGLGSSRRGDLVLAARQTELFFFGHNVRAEGTFQKISSRKTKFDDA